MTDFANSLGTTELTSCRRAALAGMPIAFLLPLGALENFQSAGKNGEVLGERIGVRKALFCRC